MICTYITLQISDAIYSLQEDLISTVMAAISSSNTAFALELFRTLRQENPTGNIFISPLSISSALAMVYLGAKGETAAQMAQVSTLICCMHFHHLTSPCNSKKSCMQSPCFSP